MRWVALIVLLLTSCAAEPNYNPRDYYYRPNTLLPRHYDLFRGQPEIVQQSQWHHNQPQRYIPRNQGWRNYNDVYRPVERHCRHTRMPINERRWRAPIYKPVFRGYDHYGVPIYIQELVSPGGWYTITVGYRCRKCRCRI